jgi:hypothetical protein
MNDIDAKTITMPINDEPKEAIAMSRDNSLSFETISVDEPRSQTQSQRQSYKAIETYPSKLGWCYEKVNNCCNNCCNCCHNIFLSWYVNCKLYLSNNFTNDVNNSNYTNNCYTNNCNCSENISDCCKTLGDCVVSALCICDCDCDADD